MTLALVACMDGRIDLDAVQYRLGKATHVIRNAGGIVTQDVIRSLIISQWVAGTDEIVLIHHTDCAMTKFDEVDLKDRIDEKYGAAPTYALGGFPAAERDLSESLLHVQSELFLIHKENIKGFMYDVVTSDLTRVLASQASTS